MSQKIIILSLALLTVSATLYLSQSMVQAQSQPDGVANTEQTEKTTHKVQVVSPSIPSVNSNLVFNGRLEANKEASLFARATGFVEERLVDIGDKVEEGQILLRLNAPELIAEMKTREAQLALAQSELKLSQNNYNRSKSLISTEAISKADMDNAKTDLNIKTEMVKARKAELEAIQANIQYLTVTAPFSGFITERTVEKGDKISPDDSQPLFRILNKDTMRVVTDIPQTQFHMIDKTQSANLIIAGFEGAMPVTFSRSAQDVNPVNGSVQVEYLFVGDSSRMLSGMNIQISVPINADNQKLTVPNSVLLNKSGQTYVFAVNDNNQAEQRLIKTGRSYSNEIEVISGISQEDKLIINPNALMKEGDSVEVMVRESEKEKK